MAHVRKRPLALRSLGLVSIASALAVSALGCSRGAAEAPAQRVAPSERPPVAIHMAIAEAHQEPVTLVLDGTLIADEDSQVTSVVAGRVVEVMVERGAVVEEGAPLVRLRDVDFRLQARAAQAQVEQARARLGMTEGAREIPQPEAMPDVRAAQSDLELAEANLRRSEELAQRGVLAAQALDEARSRAASARERYQTAVNGARASIAQLASAQASLSQASTAAREATVRAPFAGEIADRMVSVGEYVSPQTPLVSLVRTDPLRIELVVPQQHLRAVRPGQTVELRVDALPDQRFEATVRYVSAAVRRENRGLTVEAVVPNPEGALRPGLFARAVLSTGQAEDVAVVPSAAVLTQAGVDRVFVVREGAIEERVVTVIDRRNGQVVISQGLEAGEQIAIDALEQLADGVRVSPAG